MVDLGSLKISIDVNSKEANRDLKSTEEAVKDTEKSTKKSLQEMADAAKEAATKARTEAEKAAEKARIATEKAAEEGATATEKEAARAAQKAAKEANKIAAAAEKAANKAISEADKAERELKDTFSKIGAAGKKAALGMAAIGTAAVGLAESTRDYREDQAKLNTAFETAGFTSEEATNTYKELQGVLGESDTAVEAANHLAKLCDNAEDLSTWTNICTGIYATFGDSLPIESLTEAANETAKTGSITGVLADALNWAGINEDDFQAKLDKCSGEAERQKLIMDTLNTKYEEANKLYKENAKSSIAANKANENLSNSMATLGEDVDIGLTPMKILVNDCLQWIIDNEDLCVSALVGIGVGLAVFKIGGLVASLATALQTYGVATTVAAAGQAILNVVMAANPFVLIATVIATVIAAVVTFIATNEEAREKIAAVWDKIKAFFTNTFDSILTWFKNLPEKITNFCSKMKDAGKKIFNAVWDGIKGVWDNISGWVSDKVSWLTDKLNFWREGKEEMSDTETDGSKRVGFKEVPYDGYVAELHKGEMVLTAAEANQYQKGILSGGNSSKNYTINFNGSYSFSQKDDIDYFMDKAQRLIDRRYAVC